MVQESLVEYINAQMKLGVSRDTIKTTLTGAGWAAADVEDTLKKMDGAKAVPPASTAVTAAAAKPAETVKPAEPAAGRVVTPVGSGGPPPQTIKVSDLVSSSATAPMTASTPKASASKSPLTGPAPMATIGTSGMVASSPTGSAAQKQSGAHAPATAPSSSASAYSYSALSSAKPHGSRGALVTEVVLGVIALAALAFGGFLYMQNSGLTSQLSSLKSQSSGVNSQLSALQAQVAASTTALMAQASALAGETQELQAELSFYAVPSSTTPGATSTATVSGTVSSGKTEYIITAEYGAKIYVANSKDPAVIAALTSLTPLLAGTSTPPAAAQFTGTYVPGSDTITLTAVNGTAVQ